MSKTLTVFEKLNIVQTGLKVEKGHKNNFGNYNYRNLADIFEGLKPLLNENGCHVTVSDEIVTMNGMNYIKATATFSDGNDSISATGWAREPVQKKGMDDSQITGATSSYARKYACNGLFAIDDTKDADSMDNRNHKIPNYNELKGNTNGEVKSRSDNEVKLIKLSNDVLFKGMKKDGKKIQVVVNDWLKRKKRTEAEILKKYIQLSDLREGIKNNKQKEAA
jgi:hypothetical protein